ncbi:MAG: GtrA family protein [Tannerella sp.]|jgi:putative flippase GtrA|nr:GtrA family protein [Tannerella sp.]
MRKLLTGIGLLIQRALDFIYPPFRRFLPVQVYRYAACGSANMLFDLLLYFLLYNLMFKDSLHHVGPFTFSSHIAALLMVFPITTLTGFLLQKYVTFTASDLSGIKQLLRYILVVFANLLINYVGLKILVEICHFYPTPSKLLITVFTVICSYIGQKMFTFR